MILKEMTTVTSPSDDRWRHFLYKSSLTLLLKCPVACHSNRQILFDNCDDDDDDDDDDDTARQQRPLVIPASLSNFRY